MECAHSLWVYQHRDDYSDVIGVRSDMACRIAAEEGFSNVKNYKGSALEWFAE